MTQGPPGCCLRSSNMYFVSRENCVLGCWDLELEGSRDSWWGQDLQSHVQALLDACSLCEYIGGQDHYRPGLLPFGDRTLSGELGVPAGDCIPCEVGFLAQGLGKSGQLQESGGPEVACVSPGGVDPRGESRSQWRSDQA
ncbi:unnamed protein product [Staurois parvus]|uniref:Uncharacterized protein n=1 Tax=Staurois parvus TaxID=386267 RepID=A0ABN9D311_9NEOB|nr:unnamed protein product [Staurois parvus]